METNSNKNHLKSVLFILVLVMAGVNSEASGLQLVISEGYPGSVELLESRWADGERNTRNALQNHLRLRSEKQNQVQQVELLNNLCVSTLMQQKDDASSICNDAVEQSLKLTTTFTVSNSGLRRLRATALNNRAVLSALTGGIDDALRDLEDATSFKPTSQEARANLETLTKKVEARRLADLQD